MCIRDRDYTHPANERLVQADEELPHETLEAYENLTEEEYDARKEHRAAFPEQELHRDRA